MDWSPEERGIFAFEYGGEMVYKDPLVTLRTFIGKLGGRDLDALLAVVGGPMPTDPEGMARHVQAVDEAMSVLKPATCAAFGVTSLDEWGNGMTEEEMFGVGGLLDRFFAFLDGLKKKPEPSPAGSSPTAGRPEPDASTMQPMSVSN